MALPKITTKDNGYFEVWTRDCGHSVRVSTEDTNYARRNSSRRAQLQKQDRDRLASTPCRKCTEAGA
jgi:hypothetical protein